VTRSVAFAGAVALVFAQSTAAFAAPPGFMPVYHPVYRPPAAVPHEPSGTHAPLKVPFAIHRDAQQFDPQAMFNPLRWRRWQWESLPPFLPYQSACYGTGGLWTPGSLTAPGAASPAGFTIGSLVDDRSQRLFSSPSSYAQDLAASSDDVAGTSNPLTLQYGFQSMPCGAADFFNF
jgi:hypothetical protein